MALEFAGENILVYFAIFILSFDFSQMHSSFSSTLNVYSYKQFSYVLKKMIAVLEP